MATKFIPLEQIVRLMAGLNPDWVAQATVDAPNGAPALDTDGVDLKGASLALVGADMRTGQAVQQYVVIDGWDAASTYKVTINATVFAEATDTDEATTLAALEVAINNGTEPVTAAVVDGRLMIAGDEPITVTTTGGAGTLALMGDATAVDLVVWLYTGGTWRAPSNAELSIARTLGERAVVGGYERVYIEVTGTDGVVTPGVAPCWEVG